MTKPEQGKHARAKERVQASALLIPAALTGVAIALTVGAYEPLQFDPNSIAQVARAEAQELATAKATGEKTVAADPVIESNFGMDIGQLADGVYTGSARGYKSVITVKVTVAGGKIADIAIVSAGDDEPYFSRAKAVVNRVLKSQSMDVDTVSGATYSSTGILVAIKNALLQAAGKAPEATPAVSGAQSAIRPPAVDVQMPDGALADGVYRGSGMGYNDYIVVSVTVKGGAIASIDLVTTDDDEPYVSNAQAGVVPAILKQQNTNVDAVSGATYSSKGIMAAVADALEKAAAAGAGGSGDQAPDASGDGEGEMPGADPSKPSDPEVPGDDGQKPDDEPSAEVRYLDGTYSATAFVEDASRPDRFTPYCVQLTLVVKDGAVADIVEIRGIGTEDAAYDDEENGEYLDYAINGRDRRGVTYLGVKSQLLTGVRPDAVEVVSGATYSSKAIAQAYETALARAAEAYEAAYPDGAESDGDSSGAPVGASGAHAGDAVQEGGAHA